ncbi:MAG TPA: YigZ family protein [Clostridiales bacterium]|nr:YigZ family protein [Clostridiales bacterium]
MYSISENSTYEIVEKKSKFIANLIYIESKEEAENIIKEYKKRFHDARHNCYAYRVYDENEIYEKSSDDGEPSGTAGAPMLNLLQKNDLCNIIIIVTRYFGGILLGTGGLVRAYSGATIGAIDNCKKAKIELGIEFQIELDYPNYKSLQYYCNKNNITIKNSEYNENITCILEMNNTIKDRFLEDVKNKSLNILEIKNQKDIMIIE